MYYVDSLFGEKSHSAKDFWRIVESLPVYISEIYLKKPGYYAVIDVPPRIDFIFLKYNPAYYQWLEAAFHELVHFFLHHPCDGTVCKDQREAEELALILMIAERDLPRLVLEYSWQVEEKQMLIYRRLKVLHERKI
jgi:hypothetical protein